MADLQEQAKSGNEMGQDNQKAPNRSNNQNSGKPQEKPKDFIEQLKTAPVDEQTAYGCIFLGAFILLIGIILLFVM